jgi:hypothetical protein
VETPASCEARSAPPPYPGEQEPEPSQTGLRRPGENLTIRHREANVTAPLLDSTQPSSRNVANPLAFVELSSLHVPVWKLGTKLVPTVFLLGDPSA